MVVERIFGAIIRGYYFGDDGRDLRKPARGGLLTDPRTTAETLAAPPKPYVHEPDFNWLTTGDKKALHEATKQARAEINGQARNPDGSLDRAKVVAIMKRHFLNNADLNNSKALNSLKVIFERLVEDSGNGDYHSTRNLIDQIKPNFVIGFFQVPYIQGLEQESLELVTFDDFNIDQQLPTDFKTAFPDTRARAVTNVESTPGLGDLRNVALFPEFFVVPESPENGHSRNDPDSTAYYFVDRFRKRLGESAQPVFKSGLIAKDSFATLRQSSPEERLQAISTWLSAHEHNHSTGPLPRVWRGKASEAGNKPHGYKIKNTKATGAFEELRVDLLTMLKAFGDERYGIFGSKDDGKLGTLTGELILFERLVRYAYARDPDGDFDALTSHMLLNYLKEKGALSIDGNNVLALNPKYLIGGLKDLLKEMTDLETKIAQGDLSTPGLRRGAVAQITQWVNNWAGHHSDGIVSRHSFYTNLRGAMPLKTA